MLKKNLLAAAEPAFHILRKRGVKAQILGAYRMLKFQMRSVQRLARHFRRQCTVAVKLSVELVTQQWVADVRHMHAYLMRAPGIEPEPQKAIARDRLKNQSVR